jgi:hypothetical protein
MPIFKLNLIKSYIVEIESESFEKAKELTEFYTGDVIDISTPIDKETENFEILSIEYVVNEAENSFLNNY